MAFIYISNKHKQGVLNKIDLEDYFRLSSSCERLDLYNFAVALGYHQGLASELSRKDSFVREENAAEKSIMHVYSSIYYKENENKIASTIDHIADTNFLFPLTDQYANTGFSIIEDYMGNYNEEQLALVLLKEMDEMYEQYKDAMNI